MSKRTNSLVAVTFAKYATVYIEADTYEEAMKIAEADKGAIYGELMSEMDDMFDDSVIEVDSCEAYTNEADPYMDYIWADGEAFTYDEYMDQLDAQEDE